MSSPFMYSLRVISGKKGQKRDEQSIPIYGFKSGMPDSSPWIKGDVTLEVLKNIALGADGARILTVCSENMYVYRALEEKEIDFFYLAIMDNRIKTAPTEPRKVVATISAKDMTGGKRSSIDGSQINMSFESNSGHLAMVPLDLHNSSDGLTFARV